MHPACSSFAVSQVHEVYPLELLDECEKDLNQALESVSDKTIKRRIEFLQKGLIYTILTIDAVTNTKMLENCGITISAQTFTDEEELIDLDGKEKSILEQGEDINLLIENSLKAWQKRDRYVESLKDDFVISYFWIRYNDTNRVFNPTKRLLELKNKIELLND
jgi:hypothetical protein